MISVFMQKNGFSNPSGRAIKYRIHFMWVLYFFVSGRFASQENLRGKHVPYQRMVNTASNLSSSISTQ